MTKSKEEILEYVFKMRQRGDTYRSILAYINRSTEDQLVRDAIIDTLNAWEKEGKIKISSDDSKNKPYFLSKVLGAIFLFGGIVLLIFTWGSGFVFVLNLSIIGIGIAALTGSIR